MLPNVAVREVKYSQAKKRQTDRQAREGSAYICLGCLPGWTVRAWSTHEGRKIHTEMHVCARTLNKCKPRENKKDNLAHEQKFRLLITMGESKINEHLLESVQRTSEQ